VILDVSISAGERVRGEEVFDTGSGNADILLSEAIVRLLATEDLRLREDKVSEAWKAWC